MTTSASITRKTAARTATLGLAATSALLLAGCGVGTPVDTEDQGGGGGEAETTLRLAHVYEPSHPVQECGITTLQEELQGSGLAVESFPAGQLGTEAELLEQVSNGSLDMAVAGPSFLGVWHQPIEVLDAAYLFNDVDHLMETVDSEAIQAEFDELAEKSGINVMDTWYYGTRHVTSNKEIDNAEDFQGVKIRTPDAPLYITNIEAMGGTPTPMALGEVYLALQQGVIDAQENPVPTIASAKFNEVQEYINLTGHVIQSVQITAADSVLENLPEDQAEALNSALDAAADATRQCIEEGAESTLEEWRAEGGIQVNDDVDREAFAAAAEEAMLQQPWGDLYQQIREQE